MNFQHWLISNILSLITGKYLLKLDNISQFLTWTPTAKDQTSTCATWRKIVCYKIVYQNCSCVDHLWKWFFLSFWYGKQRDISELLEWELNTPVFPNYFDLRKGNHTGCIYQIRCIRSIYCVFSNVSSNDLPGRMHSHNGHICLTFLHCVFSSASANCLPRRM